MKIQLLSDNSLLVEEASDMSVEAESYAQQYTPFHMLGSSIATCTFAVLKSWAQQANLDTAGLKVKAEWKVLDKEHRLESLKVAFIWPSLPAERQKAAVRAAELCSIHKTLSHPPALQVEQQS